MMKQAIITLSVKKRKSKKIFLLFSNFQNFEDVPTVQHFIQYHENSMLDEMLDWFASAFILYLYSSI